MVVVNPESPGAVEGQRLAARGSLSEPGAIPRRQGYAWAALMARMEERALLPGETPKARLIWGRCHNTPRCGHDDCLRAGRCLDGGGTVLVCGRCWEADRKDGEVIVLGHIEAPEELWCKACGARGSEVTGEGPAPEALARIGEWNAMIDRRIERGTR